MGPKKKVQDDDDSTEKLLRIYFVIDNLIAQMYCKSSKRFN